MMYLEAWDLLAVTSTGREKSAYGSVLSAGVFFGLIGLSIGYLGMAYSGFTLLEMHKI